MCENEDPDILCLQETKLQPEQAVFDLEGYHRYFPSADKKGYSGTAVLTKEEPLSVTYGFGEDIHRHEGRVITAEYPDFYLVCCYTPNSQDGLKRLPYRMQWEDDLRAYLLELDGKKPVVYCGDLNVAHEEMDPKNPVHPTAATPGSTGRGAGEDDAEAAGRGLCWTPSGRCTRRTGAYSWCGATAQRHWEKNAGWRIDYFIVPGGRCPV
ncbi:MAG: exodeoxyribonuclease III [Dysosmobacter sp.]